MTPGNELIFLPLGGSGEIGMNVNLYGCDGKWLMVDLGMTFADETTPGIDLVLPDLTFIEDRKKDLVGIVITHGHEDHIGAIPYLAADLGVPIYASPFTAGLIRHKLDEEGLSKEVKLHIIDPRGKNGGEFQLGPFKLRHVPLAHSIPEGNALLIETSYGKVFHTGDWKLDDTPLLGKPFTAAQLEAIGDAGVLAMVCDSTNVFNFESSGSESSVREGLDQAIINRKGRVVVTTFASNAARLATLGDVARDTGRQLCVAGRSLDRILKVAQAVGYLRDMPPILTFDQAASVDPSRLLIVATGAQGEPRAALSRMAQGDHPIKLERGDLVIYSSKQIPGNEIGIGNVMNALAAKGIEIITDRQAHVHVSGHPGRPELKAMYGWIKPKVAIPVHGERRHTEEHARLAREWGVPTAIVPVDGAVIRLGPGTPRVIGHEKVGKLVLDGDVILPADGSTMQARRRISENGYLSATLVMAKGRLAAKPSILIQGLPVEEDRAAFVTECAEAATRAVNGGREDEGKLIDSVRQSLRRVARDWTGKKPVTDVSVVRV
jgi:ribonuclease J